MIDIGQLILKRFDYPKLVLVKERFKLPQMVSEVFYDVIVMRIAIIVAFFLPVVEKPVTLDLDETISIGRFEPSSRQAEKALKSTFIFNPILVRLTPFHEFFQCELEKGFFKRLPGLFVPSG